MNFDKFNYKLLQKVAEVMPFDIFKQILFYVYAVEVEDISYKNCCSKSTNCISTSTSKSISPREYGLNDLFNTCNEHSAVGVLRVESISHCVTITIPRSSFNIFNRKDIENVNFYFHALWDEISYIKTTETSLVVQAGPCTTTLFARDKYEMLIIKDKISTVLLKWYDSCIPKIRE